MSVPPKRRPASAGRKRRAHDALKTTTLGVCPKCLKAIAPHRACQFCGYYKGREEVKVKSKVAKSKKA